MVPSTKSQLIFRLPEHNLAHTLLLHSFHDNLKTNLNVSVCRFTYLTTSTFAVPPAGLLLSYKYIERLYFGGFHFHHGAIAHVSHHET